MGIGLASTPSEQLTSQRLVICLLALTFIPCPAQLCTSGNYIAQDPLFSGFLVGLSNGRHWQGEGGENPRYFSLSLLQAASLPWLVFSMVPTSTGWSFPLGLRSRWTGLAILPVSVRQLQILGPNNAASSLRSSNLKTRVSFCCC